MEELKVVVKQTPGTVTWNFEDLKAAITKELEVYKNTVYDDDSIKTAKKDRAMLNALTKSVDERRKKIKEECLKPYDLIDKQAKELIAIINEPITIIDNRVQEYEKNRRAKAKAVILEYMEKAFEGIEQDIADKAKKDLYDDRWENATAKKSEWMSAIDTKAEAIRSDLQILEGTEEEFRSFAMDAYKVNHRLSDAMAKVQEMRAQKEAILRKQKEEEERKRRQEEERQRRKAEMEAKEQERRTRQAEMEERKLKTNALAKPAEVYRERPKSDIGRTIDHIEREAFAHTTSSAPIQEPAIEPVPVQEPTIAAKPSQTVRITGSPEDYQKVIDYIKAMGIDYEEV